MKSTDAQKQPQASPSQSGQPFFGAQSERSFFSKAKPSSKPFFSAGSPVQAKLTVGAVGDQYEQEADRVAEEVVNRIHSPSPEPAGEQQAVQRMEEEEEELQAKPLQRLEEEDELQMSPLVESIQRMGEEEDELQMKPLQREAMEEDELQMMPLVQRVGAEGGEVSTDFESELNAARGGGQGLAPNLQTQMGQAMGADFSGVRVHTDGRADGLNRSVGARAFTTGQDLFFKRGEYQPGSRGGQELIAHELTHVVQQNVEVTHPIEERNSGENLQSKQAANGNANLEPIENPIGKSDQLKSGLDQLASRDVIQRVTVTATDGTTYVVKGAIPGTGIRIVRPNWHPFSTKRFLVDRNNIRLTLQLTTNTLNQVLATLAALQVQRVANIDDLVHGLDKAVALAIPLNVALDRLRLVGNNLQTVVLNRIQNDHAGIVGMYPPGTLDPAFNNAFQSIELPSSDPHKGGQVVVFINYQTTVGIPLRVVYKPSDLAMDMLLYNDTASVAATLGGGVASYQMMSMHDAAAVDPRLSHYGYMKFVESGCPQNAVDMLSVFDSLGANLAVAYVFGLRDIHHENFILQNDRIQFIDMEAATGTFNSFHAMELLTFPNVLRDKIAKGLSGTANNVVRGWLPNNAALIGAVRTGFTNTLNSMQTGGPNDAAIGGFATTASQTSTRFVPFPTQELQRLAGLFHGRLAPPLPATLLSFNTETATLATTTAAQVGAPAIQADLQFMLRAPATKDALNVGDVPYWTRQGNTIYGEDGTQQIAALAHPRLDTQANIVTGANARRTPPPIGGPLPAATAIDLLNAQFFVPSLNGISDSILNHHQIQRQILGYRHPNY